jgi:hypothetical protein
MPSADMALAEDQVARIDLALTAAMRRYITDLHFGRVDPRQLGANYSQAPGAFDARFVAGLGDHR